MEKEIIIDAKDKSLGRVATEAANCLRGKHKADYLPNVAPKISVKVINIGKAKITGNKLEKKTYKKYSGYPGNLRYVSLKKMMEKNPKALFKKVVGGMLPKNKLANRIIKNLNVEI